MDISIIVNETDNMSTATKSGNFAAKTGYGPSINKIEEKNSHI